MSTTFPTSFRRFKWGKNTGLLSPISAGSYLSQQKYRGIRSPVLTVKPGRARILWGKKEGGAFSAFREAFWGVGRDAPKGIDTKAT